MDMNNQSEADKVELSDKFNVEVASFNSGLSECYYRSGIEIRFDLIDLNESYENCFVKVEMDGELADRPVFDFRRNFDSGPEGFGINEDLFGLDTYLETDFLLGSEEEFINALRNTNFIVNFTSDEIYGSVTIEGSEVLIE